MGDYADLERSREEWRAMASAAQVEAACLRAENERLRMALRITLGLADGIRGMVLPALGEERDR